jgi:hypothetical protein
MLHYFTVCIEKQRIVKYLFFFSKTEKKEKNRPTFAKKEMKKTW